MNSFVGKVHMDWNIVPGKDEVVKVPLMMASVVTADSCYTDDILHLTVDLTAALDKRVEMQRAVNS